MLCFLIRQRAEQKIQEHFRVLGTHVNSGVGPASTLPEFQQKFEGIVADPENIRVFGFLLRLPWCGPHGMRSSI